MGHLAPMYRKSENELKCRSTAFYFTVESKVRPRVAANEILDSGSNASYIHERLVKPLLLTANQEVEMEVQTVQSAQTIPL